MDVAKGFSILLLVCISMTRFSECGNTCVSCSGANYLSDCTHLETCKDDEVCYMHKYFTESKEEKYDYGCMYPELCNHHYSGSLFGRSLETGHHIVCQGCCNNTNVCNMKIPCEIANEHNASAATNLPVECDDIQSNQTGVYTIYPDGTTPVQVYCIMANNEKWTVIQRRFNGSVDFYRNWMDYQKGFGSPSGEYWLGNDNIHLISSSSGHKLSIYLQDFEANFKYANYSFFLTGDERHKYQLSVMGFSGTSGVGDSLIYHSNRPFSTKDRDNSGYNCPVASHGAWWYGNCQQSNLNGHYLAGPVQSRAALEWSLWKIYYSLKKTTMMIKRK